jgi:hypothetical protein
MLIAGPDRPERRATRLSCCYVALDQQADIPTKRRVSIKLSTLDSVYGPLSFLATPLRFSNLVLPVAASIEPYGANSSAGRESQSMEQT